MSGFSAVQDDKLFTAKLEDMYMQCERGCCSVYSFFLDERQCAVAERFCCGLRSDFRFRFWGGFEEAQRKMLCIYEEYAEGYIMDEFPMKCLTFTWRKEYTLSHRDFLGSLMAMRLKREVIGDIVIDEGTAQIFVTDTAAKLILSTVSKIGKIGVSVTDSKPFMLEIKQEFEETGCTVASMRLDCIVAAAAKTSRENAARLIRSEKVSVNHFPILSLSHEVCEGDTVSVRGSGRFILGAVNGTTKKGRIHIILRKYK